MSHSEHREVVAAEARAAVARQQPKLTLPELSERTGIPKSTLATKLRGRSDFSVSELIWLAQALGVPARTLITPADSVMREAV